MLVGDGVPAETLANMASSLRLVVEADRDSALAFCSGVPNYVIWTASGRLKEGKGLRLVRFLRTAVLTRYTAACWPAGAATVTQCPRHRQGRVPREHRRSEQRGRRAEHAKRRTDQQPEHRRALLGQLAADAKCIGSCERTAARVFCYGARP
jgi:hypothetical protein